jgi:CRP/FNR family transcriptional regulator, cyclic AMP receptor protein
MLGPGAIDGELAIIDGGPRSASVFAVRDCELSFVSRAESTSTSSTCWPLACDSEAVAAASFRRAWRAPCSSSASMSAKMTARGTS